MRSPPWVGLAFAGLALDDKRLDPRLTDTYALLAMSPGALLNRTCGTCAATEGAHLLFDTRRASPEAILRAPIRERTRRPMAVTGLAPAAPDTVFQSYGRHP